MSRKRHTVGANGAVLVLQLSTTFVLQKLYSLISSSWININISHLWLSIPKKKAVFQMDCAAPILHREACCYRRPEPNQL